VHALPPTAISESRLLRYDGLDGWSNPRIPSIHQLYLFTFFLSFFPFTSTSEPAAQRRIHTRHHTTPLRIASSAIALKNCRRDVSGRLFLLDTVFPPRVIGGEEAEMQHRRGHASESLILVVLGLGFFNRWMTTA